MPLNKQRANTIKSGLVIICAVAFWMVLVTWGFVPVMSTYSSQDFKNSVLTMIISFDVFAICVIFIFSYLTIKEWKNGKKEMEEEVST